MVRTSVILAAVAAALLAYILVFERGSISSGEREQRKGNALVEFVRARVSKLEIQRKGVTTVLTRDPDADVEDDASLWHVQAPYQAKADQEAVDTLLGELEWLDGRRKLENITAEDRKRFGFDNPRYRLWFTVGKTRVPVLVGNMSPRGDGVYVNAADPGTAWVIGKTLPEALDREAGEYHTKELHDGVMVPTAIALTLRDAQGEREVRKADDALWRFERGGTGLASTPAISTVIEALDSLRARRYVAQGGKDLARYGLDRPRFELRVRTTTLESLPKDKNSKPSRKESTLALRVGSACAGHAAESYVAVDGGAVLCAADEDLNKLGKSAQELRETRLLPLDASEVTDVQIASGDRKLVLTRSDETWSYELTRAGKTVLKGQARADAVPDWLKALGAVSATRFDAPKLAPGKAAISARFGRGKDRPAFELWLSGSGGEESLAQRGDEANAVAFPASAGDLLAPEAARFRALKLRDQPTASLQRAEIRRGTQVEVLQRSGDVLLVQTPVNAPADTVAASELGRLLGSLEAVRFVADAPAASHGLSTPALTLTAELAPPPARDGKSQSAAPERVVLRLGEATEGGRFAQVDGTPGVFVASSQLADLLSAPLVSRTLLATPLERLRSVEVQHGSARVRVERRGDQFVAAAGANLGARSPQALAEAVATLRAVRVAGYGPAEAAHGLQRPFATVTVSAAAGEGTGEQRYTIALGTEVDGGRYARRDDHPITFVLPKASVDALVPGA